MLLDTVQDATSARADYLAAIQDQNCLGKRSDQTRRLTYRHLTDLYALSPDVTLFQALRFFWQRDVDGRPMLALLCAYARDPVFRLSAPLIQSTTEGSQVKREDVEAAIDAPEPGRFSKATLKSTAQNVGASWTQSGHLQGKARKIRSRATATPGSVAYALLLSHLVGDRGQTLFTSEYARLLDCSAEIAMEHAETAARRGWIVLKRVGTVVEVQFPAIHIAVPQEAVV